MRLVRCWPRRGRSSAGLEVETRACGGGSPAGILTSLSESEEFDAIVVGSPHRGPIGRVMVGSVAMSLLNGASTDLAVAPRGYAESDHEPPRRTAVGYDGSAEAKVALRRAEVVAERSKATVEVVTVVRPAAATPVMAHGVNVPQRPQDPEKVINEALNSVVVGSRGYGPVAPVLLGSVSHRVVNTAPCPVLVARRP